jgi:hypothetical protein
VGYDFVWRMSGIKPFPRLNGARAGDPLYLKFSLGENAGLDVLPAGSIQMQTISCSSGAPIGAPVALPLLQGLRFMPGGYYQLVWRTQTSWAGSCRQVILAFDDGTEQRLNFRFSRSG